MATYTQNIPIYYPSYAFVPLQPYLIPTTQQAMYYNYPPAAQQYFMENESGQYPHWKDSIESASFDQMENKIEK
jgi:hypothetical protein